MRIFKRISKYIGEVRGELKKVNWPTRREFSVFTGIVLSAVLVIGAFFWLLDTMFLAILQLVIR
ncbi:MAG: preprotein translocase subunit SecE [Firmicutes bacterium]|nr:preprotein translocase subunit SecE [Bacillota bacterium]